MKLYQKIASLLAVAALVVVMLPVCMAAPGDSITIRVTNAFNVRGSADLYEEMVVTNPDGSTQTTIMSRSGGNVYMKMEVPGAGTLVYLLKDGEGYLLDEEAKIALKGGAAPTVTLDESAAEDTSEAVQPVETRVNVNGQEYDALAYTYTSEDGQTATRYYCVDGDAIKCTVTDAPDGRTIVEFRNVTTSVNPDLFNIPADYQVMTEEEWEALTANK